jgi:Helix-turn-helix domain
LSYRQPDKHLTYARLRVADELRRDKDLSPAVRLVGLEIFSRVNRATGNSFPSEVTIASDLGITDRCVRTAVKQLDAAGYLKITRRGRNNVYSPILTKRKAEHSSGIPQSPAKPEADDTNTGTQFQNTGTQVPPNSLLNPVLTLGGSLATAPPTGALRSPHVRKQQETENEIGQAIGWECFAAMPPSEAESLRNRWPVDEAERLELKRKYAAPRPSR